jgi:hypothetical protein
VHDWERTTGVIPSRSRRIDMTDHKRPPVHRTERIETIWRQAAAAAVAQEDWLETADDEDDDAEDDDAEDDDTEDDDTEDDDAEDDEDEDDDDEEEEDDDTADDKDEP